MILSLGVLYKIQKLGFLFLVLQKQNALILSFFCVPPPHGRTRDLINDI